MLDHIPTVRARHLGRELSQVVEKTGRTDAEMASLLAWSPSKLSRLLSGKRMASPVDIATLLGLCGVAGRRRDELLKLAEDVYAPTWWQDYGDRPPIHRQTLTDNEAIATAIISYHNTLVPDLLQTPAYTRALLRALPNIPAEEVDDRVTDTMARQQILERTHPPVLRVFLDAYVLTRTGGGDEVMSDQAHHLLRMAVRPGIELRVILEPDGIRNATPFTLLEFAALPTVTYLEQPTSAAFLEADETTTAYEHVVAELDQRALSEVDTRTWVADISQHRSTHAPPADRTGPSFQHQHSTR
jgi:transcriptional regulator with XRE-family HTH domain